MPPSGKPVNRRDIVQRFLDAGLLVHPNVVSYVTESSNPAKVMEAIIRRGPEGASPLTLRYLRYLKQTRPRLLTSSTDATKEQIAKLRALKQSSPYAGERLNAKRKADALEESCTDTDEW